ncbi:MAG: hypothetical protein ACSHYF_07795 [Verrucomicrobiaceae bacterium]
MKRKLMVFFLVVVVGGVVLFSLKGGRNLFFEYCTTKAYGFPFPWKIENCECDGRGGETVYPLGNRVINVGFVVMSAVFVGLVTPGKKGG